MIANDAPLINQLTLAQADRDSFRAECAEKGLRILDLEAEMKCIVDNASKMLEAAQAANRDLTGKLAAAQAELHDLRIHAGLADQGWQPLTEDDDPVHCACCDDDCNTEAWIEQGILCLEDADGMRVSFDLGEDYAFMRRAGIAATAT